MLKTISAALLLLVAQASSALATTYTVHPTEGQYIRYEIALEQFFSLPEIAPDAGKYFRTSDRQRRFDGQFLCSMLTGYPTDEYLNSQLNEHRLLYKDPQQLRNENIYSLGVAAAAINTICTEHRADLMDFVQNYQQNQK
jgi:hypothetical protein